MVGGGVERNFSVLLWGTILNTEDLAFAVWFDKSNSDISNSISWDPMQIFEFFGNLKNREIICHLVKLQYFEL